VNTHALSIRFASSEDAAGIAALSRDEIERGLPSRWNRGRVERAISDCDTNVIVAGPTDHILGFGIMKYRDDEAHLLLFAVASTHRRRGFGSALLQWLEIVARDVGIVRVRVECRRGNDAARNFYGEHGYHEAQIARGYYQGREDAIILVKHLLPGHEAPR
jgi:ribosomal-protein-alanine N-acetyltransferase